MMDYEFRPANHLSFRIANRVVVPVICPRAALRRFGARERRVVRYEGFKEELYLGNFQPREDVLSELGLDRSLVMAVMRPLGAARGIRSPTGPDCGSALGRQRRTRENPCGRRP